VQVLGFAAILIITPMFAQIIAQRIPTSVIVYETIWHIIEHMSYYQSH